MILYQTKKRRVERARAKAQGMLIGYSNKTEGPSVSVDLGNGFSLDISFDDLKAMQFAADHYKKEYLTPHESCLRQQS